MTFEAVVGVEKHQVLAVCSRRTVVTRLRQPLIQLADDAHLLVADSIENLNRFGIRRSVIDHDHFHVRISLRQDRADGIPNILAVVMAWDDH